MHLACRQEHSQRMTSRIHRDVNLRAQAATRSANRLVLSPPFAPAACWCARTIVASIIMYSKSGSSANALKRLSQMPFFAQRLNRTNTLFQSPNADGRSRQGAPVRKIQSTASTNSRLSSPGRPLSPFLPGTQRSIRDHCTSVSARRTRSPPSRCDLESQ